VAICGSMPGTASGHNANAALLGISDTLGAFRPRGPKS
jgi:hypothetical protein